MGMKFAPVYGTLFIGYLEKTCMKKKYSNEKQPLLDVNLNK